MKFIFHGGAREVGRSCIELQTAQGRFILDAGVKLGTDTEYPTDIKQIRNIDAALLTHGHLDHCGSWPYLQHKGLTCPIYMTLPTRDIAKVLLKDFYHVESLSHIPAYPKQSIFEAFNLFRTKPYGQGFEVKDAYFKFFDAGHIPGSAYVLIEAEGKRIIYTGDIKLNETQLLKGADLQVHDIDTLIMETTYGNREHSERKKTEKEFLNKIEEVLKRGGNVFIASFAVGRTQELMLLLHTRNWDVPVYIDGLGRDITDLVIEHAACKDNQALIDARTKSSYINGRADRETALQGQGIFVASAGMMTGGAIIEYLKQCHQDPKNAFLLSGYVDDGTNGRMLLDEGSVFIEGRKTKVKAEYKQYDFSAHAGLSELQTLVKKINPRRVILLHGEDDALNSFADWLRKNNKEVYIPGVDSELNI